MYAILKFSTLKHWSAIFVLSTRNETTSTHMVEAVQIRFYELFNELWPLQDSACKLAAHGKYHADCTVRIPVGKVKETTEEITITICLYK